MSGADFPWPWVPPDAQTHGLLAYHLNSGSSGNCTLYSDGQTHVLIDLGLSLRQLRLRLRRVGLTPQDIHALFLTHLHADHCTPAVAEVPFPVFIHPKQLSALPHPMVAAPLCAQVHRWLPMQAETTVGTLTLTAFEVSHDAPGNTVGYLVQKTEGDGPVIFYATDTGQVTNGMVRALGQAHFVALEANHSPRLLRRTRRPASLINRILGSKGHLSNFQAAQAFRWRLQQSPPPVGLMALHLSGEANHSRTVRGMLRALARDHGVGVFVASRSGPVAPLWITRQAVWQEPQHSAAEEKHTPSAGRLSLPLV